jgi:hypothetical protein
VTRLSFRHRLSLRHTVAVACFLAVGAFAGQWALARDESGVELAQHERRRGRDERRFCPQSLQPVDEIVAQARRIGESNLAERLPQPGSQDEPGRLIRACAPRSRSRCVVPIDARPTAPMP